MNSLNNIQRYSEESCMYERYIAKSDNGEHVKYDDVEKIIKHIMQEHEIQLDKEYERGYDKGLDAAYESNCFRKD
jgi:hypothetical protein